MGQLRRSFSKDQKLSKFLVLASDGILMDKLIMCPRFYIPNHIRDWFSAHVGASNEKWGVGVFISLSAISFNESSKRGFNRICTWGGQICPPLSYFNIAPKLTKVLLWCKWLCIKFNKKHFQKTLGSVGLPEVTSFLRLSDAPKEFHSVLSTMHAYQCTYSNHSTPSSLLMLLSWNKTFYWLINVLHHHYVIDDVIIQNYCFFCGFSK